MSLVSLSHHTRPQPTRSPHPLPLPVTQLPEWKLDPKDTTLLDLMPFLEAVVRTQVPDVRDVVKSYDGTDIPTAFRERMSRVQQAQRQKQTAGSFLGGLAGRR